MRHGKTERSRNRGYDRKSVFVKENSFMDTFLIDTKTDRDRRHTIQGFSRVVFVWFFLLSIFESLIKRLTKHMVKTRGLES